MNGPLLIKNLRVRGYTQTIETTTGRKSLGILPHVTQFVSHPITNLFGLPVPMLDLPIRETPDVPWDPIEKWAGVEKFKQKDAKDDTAAIQAAIDSGATTVYFPHRNYKISATIFIRGNVPGDVFLEDVCSNPFTSWQFGRQHVWARQFNVENQGTHVLN
jgi:hypothetical protein